MSLTSTIKLAISATQRIAQDLGTAELPLNYSQTNSLANGTGANQANELFADQRTLAASVAATATLTFTGAPVADETFVLNGVTFTAKTSGASGDQFNIGGNVTATAAAVVAAVNASVSVGVADVITASNVAGVVTFTADDVGDEGNDLTLTESLTNATRTVFAGGTSTTENLDLAGALTNAFGQTITFTKIKALAIVAAAGNTNDVVVGGASSNGFVSPFGDATDKIKIRPGGMFLITAPDATGFAVTAGTGDILLVANVGGTPVTYDVVIAGVA
jgi:hypothetical protein